MNLAEQLAITLWLASLVTLAPASGPHEKGCDSVKTTTEGIACRQAQMDLADQKMNRYLDAAKVHAKEGDLLANEIDAEQASWQDYMMKHCGNVYMLWRLGSIRYDMDAQCVLRLTRTRTFEIWSAYLTFIDSTPSLLPNPSQ